MQLRLGFLSILLLATGCQSPGLRYKADPQIPGANISADVTPVDDAIMVSIYTDGGRLDQAFIRKPDGADVEPLVIVRSEVTPRPPPSVPPAGSGGSPVVVNRFGTHIDSPAPRPPAPQDTRPLTTAKFSLAQIGPAPWQLHLKITGFPEAIIPNLGAPPK